MKKAHTFLVLLFGVTLFQVAHAQSIKEIYSSKKSTQDRYERVMRLSSITTLESFASERIKFEAGRNPNIKKQLWKYEALTPNMKKVLNATFPGIGAWYERIARESNISLFNFQSEINGLSFEAIAAIKTAPLPNTVLGQINYYTVKMHSELFYSENLKVSDARTKLVGLYNSLNQSDKEILQIAYQPLWAEQVACYEHKQQHANCVCGGKVFELATFPNCAFVKDLELHPEFTTPDEATKVLVGLNQGDLSFVAEANRLMLNVWGNAKTDIVKQLCFLQLATLGYAPMTAQMKPNLVVLWDGGERYSSNEYYSSLGLNREILVSLENYYNCILQSQSFTVPVSEEVASKDVVSEEVASDEIPVSPVSLMTSAKPIVLEAVSPKKPVIEPPYVKKPYTAYALEKAVSKNLENELSNHRKLAGTCIDARAINDSTYEVILNGCDSSRQIFPLGKYEAPEIADFFYYCSNIVTDELAVVATQLPLTFVINVTGTADAVPYSKNSELAHSRARYIKGNLGQKAQKMAQSISTSTKTGLPTGKRYVALTFVLKTTRQALPRAVN